MGSQGLLYFTRHPSGFAATPVQGLPHVASTYTGKEIHTISIRTTVATPPYLSKGRDVLIVLYIECNENWR